MGNQKDLGEKILEDIPEIFADIVNVLLFDGRNVIKEEELEDSEARSQYKCDENYHEQERDVAKFWKQAGIRIACCGFENQTEPDKYMPLRVISYDGGSYRSQLIRNADEENEGHVDEANAVIHGDGTVAHPMREPQTRPHGHPKEITTYPVITLVLYFGTKKRWSAPKSLLESLDVFPPELKDKVNDYKINVFEIAFLPRETIDKFKSDFWFVADYFGQMRNNSDYKPSKKKIKYAHAVMQAMAAFTRDKSFAEAYNRVEEQGGEHTMCEYVDNLKAEGRKEGRAEGQESGIKAMIYENLEEHVPEEKIKAKLVKFFGLSEEDAERYIEKYALQPA